MWCVWSGLAVGRLFHPASLEAATKLLQGIIETPLWKRRPDGSILVPVQSEAGMSSASWLAHFRELGGKVDQQTEKWAKDAFADSVARMVEVVILPHSTLAKMTRVAGDSFTIDDARIGAFAAGFVSLKPDTACLLREYLPDSELERMGLMSVLAPLGGITDLLEAKLPMPCIDITRDIGGNWFIYGTQLPQNGLRRDFALAFEIPS